MSPLCVGSGRYPTLGIQVSAISVAAPLGRSVLTSLDSDATEAVVCAGIVAAACFTAGSIAASGALGATGPAGAFASMPFNLPSASR